jgi:hypothetical protein
VVVVMRVVVEVVALCHLRLAFARGRWWWWCAREVVPVVLEMVLVVVVVGPRHLRLAFARGRWWRWRWWGQWWWWRWWSRVTSGSRLREGGGGEVVWCRW